MEVDHPTAGLKIRTRIEVPTVDEGKKDIGVARVLLE
jgi:hypothetical protein